MKTLLTILLLISCSAKENDCPPRPSFEEDEVWFVTHSEPIGSGIKDMYSFQKLYETGTLYMTEEGNWSDIRNDLHQFKDSCLLKLTYWRAKETRAYSLHEYAGDKQIGFRYHKGSIVFFRDGKIIFDSTRYEQIKP